MKLRTAGASTTHLLYHSQRDSETNLVTVGAVPGAYVLRSRENLEILSMIGICTDSGRQPKRILVAERFVSDYIPIVGYLYYVSRFSLGY